MLQHAGAATTAPVRTRPGILDEARAAIDVLQRGTNPVLQITQEGIDSFDSGRHLGIREGRATWRHT